MRAEYIVLAGSSMPIFLLVQDLEQRGGHPEDMRVLRALWNIFSAFAAPREELLEAAAEEEAKPSGSDINPSDASPLPNGECLYASYGLQSMVSSNAQCDIGRGMISCTLANLMSQLHILQYCIFW